VLLGVFLEIQEVLDILLELLDDLRVLNVANNRPSLSRLVEIGFLAVVASPGDEH